MNPKIRLHIRIENGRLLTNKNARRIIARHNEPVDHNGNRLQKGKDGVWKNSIGQVFGAPYFETFRIRYQRGKGYIFQEERNGHGICGFHKSVRALVIATFFSDIFGPTNRYTLEVLPEEHAGPVDPYIGLDQRPHTCWHPSQGGKNADNLPVIGAGTKRADDESHAPGGVSLAQVSAFSSMADAKEVA